MPYAPLKNEQYNNLGGINAKSSEYSTASNEQLELENLDFTKQGALTQRWGTTLYSSATFSGRVLSLYEFIRLNGASYLLANANTNLYKITDTTAQSILNVGVNTLFSFVTFVDRLFLANGQIFQKYDGASFSNVGLPTGGSLSIGSTGTGGMSGIFTYSYGYINDRGYIGPASVASTLSVGGVFSNILTGFTVPANFGITAISIYRSQVDSVNRFQIGTMPATQATFVDANLPQLILAPPSYNQFTLIPKYLSIFNNSLFSSGFSQFPSRVAFSDIGEPEGQQIDWFFEVRTNDGDQVLGHETYSDNLLIFKKNSTYRLLGDNVDNYSLSEITTQYGCLSNRSIVKYLNYICWLDKKGIVQFNGAQVEVISTKIERLLNRINIDAAIDNATSIHVQARNELWFSFPIDGANYNNALAVFDYVAGAWTTFTGVNPSILALVQQNKERKFPFFGSYTGTIYNYGQSLLRDYDKAITCMVLTSFFGDLGESVTKQFRRLYINTDSLGSSSALDIKLYSDFDQSTVKFGATMILSTFQNRIDFGVPGKAMAVRLSYGGSFLLRLYGFTLEYRYQRNV